MRTTRAVSDLDQLVCVQVSCGSHHTAAVTDAGELFCWGSNEFGAVGVSDRRRTSSRSPRALAAVEAAIGRATEKGQGEPACQTVVATTLAHHKA